MSLKLNFIIPKSGMTIQNAITKIMYFKGSYKQDEKYNLIISTCTYASEDAKNNGLKPVDENREYDFYLDASQVETSPILTVCYNFLKTLPEFAGAVDC